MSYEVNELNTPKLNLRKILFLDFDGVLHSDLDLNANFCKVPCLEKFLIEMPDVEIVISSTWRENYSLKELKAFSPALLRDRIIDVTPVLEGGFYRGGRQREIEDYLQTNGLQAINASWVALDDWVELFDKGCSFLIWVNPARGFGDDEGRALVRWYETGSAF